METKTIHILMIDDHPSQIEGYKTILKYNNLGLIIETTAAFTSQQAYEIIIDLANALRFDLVFLDRSLPPYLEKDIKTGEDLAILIQSFMPATKIVILTSHSEAFVLYNIVKRIEPAGLLVKSDFTAEELLSAFDEIIDGEIYYSETVKESIRELLSREEYLDSYNRQIITLLSQGIKTKNIPEHLNLSQSTIEKRKVQIKDYLCIDKGTDEDIVREARRLGFI